MKNNYRKHFLFAVSSLLIVQAASAQNAATQEQNAPVVTSELSAKEADKSATQTATKTDSAAKKPLAATPTAAKPTTSLANSAAAPRIAEAQLPPDLTSVTTPSVLAPSNTVKPSRRQSVQLAPRPESARPTALPSRHADGEQLMLARLAEQLRLSKSRLNRADASLGRTNTRLQSFSGTLRRAMLEAGPDARGLHPFVRVAERYAGTPYVWGGESARGFDCSGFIIRVMRDLGYKALPHSAAEQFNYGKPIAQALLKPGDIVFFANTYKPGISHVGIYLGKRRFIHAAGTGLGTIVSSLDSAKYQAKYAGARRLINAR